MIPSTGLKKEELTLKTEPDGRMFPTTNNSSNDH